jgi:hypothetical protein
MTEKKHLSMNEDVEEMMSWGMDYGTAYSFM